VRQFGSNEAASSLRESREICGVSWGCRFDLTLQPLGGEMVEFQV
jgi:hypothetical protein